MSATPAKWPPISQTSLPQESPPTPPESSAAPRLSPVARFLLPLLILALAVAGFMALRATRPAALPVQAQEKAWRVSTQVVMPGSHVPSVLLYGTVEAPREASLSAAVAADVIEVRVAEGEAVEAGQTLVVLDQRDIALLLRQREADVAEIQASIDSERRRHRNDLIALERERAMVELDEQAVARVLDLQKRQVGSQSLVDEARQELERQALLLDERRRTVDDHPARMAQLEARLQRATALRDQARLDLERARIRAPFAGRVAQVPVAPGDRVRVGDLLIELYAVSELEIRAQIPFRYLTSVRAALTEGDVMTASSRVEGRNIRAVLARLSGETARGVGGVDALFRITAGAEALLPGRLLPLQLELPAEAGTVALPYSALYGLDRIYRLEQGRMAALGVERVGEGRDASGEVHVLVRSPELRPGDQVIVTQLPNAVAGLKVTAVK